MYERAILKVVEDGKIGEKLEVKVVVSPQLGGKARFMRTRWGRGTSEDDVEEV